LPFDVEVVYRVYKEMTEGVVNNLSNLKLLIV